MVKGDVNLSLYRAEPGTDVLKFHRAVIRTRIEDPIDEMRRMLTQLEGFVQEQNWPEAYAR